MTMLENRMVIDSEWPDEPTETAWDRASYQEQEDYLSEDEIAEAVADYPEGTDLCEVWDALDRKTQKKIATAYIEAHEDRLASRYNEEFSGDYLD